MMKAKAPTSEIIDYHHMEHGFLIRGNMELDITAKSCDKALNEIFDYFEKHSSMDKSKLIKNFDSKFGSSSSTFSSTSTGTSSHGAKSATSSSTFSSSKPPSTSSVTSASTSTSASPQKPLGVDINSFPGDSLKQKAQAAMGVDSTSSFAKATSDSIKEKAVDLKESAKDLKEGAKDTMSTASYAAYSSAVAAKDGLSSAAETAKSVGETIVDKAKSVYSATKGLFSTTDTLAEMEAKDKSHSSSSLSSSSSKMGKYETSEPFIGDTFKSTVQEAKGGLNDFKEYAKAAVSSAKENLTSSTQGVQFRVPQDNMARDSNQYGRNASTMGSMADKNLGGLNSKPSIGEKVTDEFQVPAEKLASKADSIKQSSSGSSVFGSPASWSDVPGMKDSSSSSSSPMSSSSKGKSWAEVQQVPGKTSGAPVTGLKSASNVQGDQGSANSSTGFSTAGKKSSDVQGVQGSAASKSADSKQDMKSSDSKVGRNMENIKAPSTPGFPSSTNATTDLSMGTKSPGGQTSKSSATGMKTSASSSVTQSKVGEKQFDSSQASKDKAKKEADKVGEL
jgi:hypothetical protein